MFSNTNQIIQVAIKIDINDLHTVFLLKKNV